MIIFLCIVGYLVGAVVGGTALAYTMDLDKHHDTEDLVMISAISLFWPILMFLFVGYLSLSLAGKVRGRKRKCG